MGDGSLTSFPENFMLLIQRGNFCVLPIFKERFLINDNHKYKLTVAAKSAKWG